MKHLLTGAAFAALVAVAFAGAADAKAMAKAKAGHRMHHHAGIYYSWYGPYAWGPAHAKSDFVANAMNRREVGLIAYNGALGMDQIMLNPQPLPPKAR